MTGHLVEARARAEGRLDATCRIGPPGGDATYDWDEHRTTVEAADPVYEGPCGVSRDTSRSSDGEVGERQLTGRGWVVRLPVSAGVVERGHVVTVLTVGPVGDPSIVGAPLTVDEVDMRTTMVLRRLRCLDAGATGARLP